MFNSYELIISDKFNITFPKRLNVNQTAYGPHKLIYFGLMSSGLVGHPAPFEASTKALLKRLLIVRTDQRTPVNGRQKTPIKNIEKILLSADMYGLQAVMSNTFCPPY